MGRTKEMIEDLRTVCVMPYSTYKDINHLENVYHIKTYNNSLREHYKNNEDWQQLDEEYKKAREKKENLESKIEFKMLNNK